MTTSHEAYESLLDDLPRLRRVVYDVVEKASKWSLPFKGMTCEQVEEKLGLKHQTVSPRFTELKQSGLIVMDGRRRRTRSGRQAYVWVVNKA